MPRDVLGHLLINRKKVFDIALLQHFKVGFISSEILSLLEAIGVGKGYFLGIGIGTATVVIVILFLIGTAPEVTRASIILEDEEGNPLTAIKVILDDIDLGPTTGEIEVGVLDVGNHTLIIFISDAQFIKTFYFSGQDTILIQLKSSITLNISDIETSVAIDAIDVYVDGTYKGKTTQDGQLDLTNISPGRHRVGLDVPRAEGMVERYIDVGEEDQVTLTVDMPNPSFVVTAKVDTWYDVWHLDEKGRVTVTLTNMGELPSEGTIAVVFVYRMDTYQKIAERIIPFGQIPPYPQSGSSSPEDTGEISEFVWGPTEEAVVIVVDKSKYVPQDEQGMTRISNSISVVGQALRDSIEWVRNNPQIIGTIAKIFIGDPLGALL